MGFLLAFAGGMVLLNAFSKSDKEFATPKTEWEVAIGIVLMILGAILMLVRGDDD